MEVIGCGDEFVGVGVAPVCFQCSHFLCAGEGRRVVMVVCRVGSVGVLMRFVWRSLGVGMSLLGWGGPCVFGDVSELVSEFWTSHT